MSIPIGVLRHVPFSNGSDTFVYLPGFGNDRIDDFDANPAGGQDFLDVSAFGIAAFDFGARVKILDIGADTLVVIDGNLRSDDQAGWHWQCRCGDGERLPSLNSSRRAGGDLHSQGATMTRW